MSQNFFYTSAYLIIGTLYSIIFFSEIYTEIYTILFLSVYLLLLTIFKLKKIIFTKKILITIYLFLIFILYYFLNKNNGVINDHGLQLDFIVHFNILYSLVAFFVFFMIGYLYSLQFSYPLKILAKIFSIQMICFFMLQVYLYINGAFIYRQVNLGVGLKVFLFLPYFMIAFNLKNKKTLILLYFTLAIFLIMISNRSSLIAVTIFFISYSIYPFLIKKKNFFKSYFFINLFFIFIIYLFYLIFYDNEILTQLSRDLFHKKLNSRAFIWLELIEIIKQKFWLGYGSDQISQNIFYEGDFNRVNLSSHSSYFEILLTGGLLGLLMFLLLFYSIFIQFFSYSENYWGRVGSSFLIGLLYHGMTAQFLVLGNLVDNFIIYIFIAIAVAQVTKVNHLNNKSNKFKNKYL